MEEESHAVPDLLACPLVVCGCHCQESLRAITSHTMLSIEPKPLSILQVTNITRNSCEQAILCHVSRKLWLYAALWTDL